MRRVNVRILALAALTLFMAAGGAIMMQKALYTNSLSTRPFTVGITEPVEKLEPASLQNHSQHLLAAAIYEGLVCYNEARQSLEPRLARKWQYSPDGKSVTIFLRKDVKFSNGKRLTAQDVKASFEYNISHAAEWSNTCLYLPIAGSKEKINGKSPEVTGIQVLDKSSLKITLQQPHAAFMTSLSNPIFWVMDLESGLTPPAGTGPYILHEQKAQSLQLLRNDQYYRGQPRLSALHVTIYQDEETAFKDFQQGKLDLLNAVPAAEVPGIRQSKDENLLLEKPVLETYCLGFNLQRDPYVRSYLLRRALNYAIDREQIIKQMPNGAYLPAKGLIPAGLAGYNKDIYGYRYDADKARQLLAEAGYPDGQGLPVLTLTYNDDPGHALVAEEVARQLGQFGIRVQTQQQSWDYFKKEVNNRSLSFFRLSWAADYPDADSYLYSLFHSSQIGMTNYCGYKNPQVDKILNDSRQQFEDQQARLALLQRAEAMILDDAPCLWLFQKKAQKLIGPEVRNLKLDRMEMIDWLQVELHRPTIEKASKD